jgi:DNA-binding Lrp family transcriptional regulator
VSQEYFTNKVLSRGGGLAHEDVEVLGLEVLASTKKEIIKQLLEKVSKVVGVPVQIVADNGSDLAAGIKLYQENHPEVIATHDVTHALALLLKYQLDADDKYQSFIQRCHQCKQQIKQTELAFLDDIETA